MRRREAPRPAEAPAPAGSYDWVSPPATTGEPAGGTIVERPAPAGATEAEKIAAARVPDLRASAARHSADPNVVPLANQPSALDAGDSLTVTMGKEILYPVKFNGVEVGPLSATVRIRPGETAAQAWGRARGVLEQLFEAEFDLQVKQLADHLGRARDRVREQ